MRKFIVYGILAFGLHHAVKPVAKGAFKVTKFAAKVAYKVAV